MRLLQFVFERMASLIGVIFHTKQIYGRSPTEGGIKASRWMSTDEMHLVETNVRAARPPVVYRTNSFQNKLVTDTLSKIFTFCYI